MNKILAAILLAPGLLFSGELQIKDPWMRAVPPAAKATAVFMTIVNQSEKPVSVVGGMTPIAGEVKPMITTQSKVDGRDVIGMEFADGFTVQAGKKHVLEPGGDHMMLMKLKSVPQAGTSVPLILQIISGGEQRQIALQVPVR